MLQIFPPVKHVLDKFRHKLPKDELKRLGKEIAKKLVASDYKNNRVEDPRTKLSEKQVIKIKKYVKDFLDRAVQKYTEQQKRKAAKSSSQDKSTPNPDLPDITPSDSPAVKNGQEGDEEDVTLSDVDELETPSGSDRKRKHAHVLDSEAATPSEGSDVKRLRSQDEAEPSPPPPPPPPPDTSREEAVSEERRELREQEEELMRENEEAQRLEDEAAKTKEMEQATQRMQSEIAASAL